MINIQNNATAMDQGGNLILSDGKILYWYRDSTIKLVKMNIDGTVNLGPIDTTIGTSNFANTYIYSVELINGFIIVSVYAPGASGAFTRREYDINLTFITSSVSGPYGFDYYMGQKDIPCWNVGLTKQYITTGIMGSWTNASQVIRVITQDTTSPYSASFRTISGFTTVGSNISFNYASCLFGFNHHTVAQIVRGTTISAGQLSSGADGLLHITEAAATRINYTTLNASIVAQAGSVLLVKGWNSIIYVIYRVSDNSVRYRIWDTITNTFGTESTLEGAGGRSTGFTSVDRQCNFTLIGTNEIYIGHGLKDGYTSCSIYQDLSTNALIVSSHSTQTITSGLFKNKFIGKGTKSCYLSSANGFRSIDTATLNQLTEVAIPASGDTELFSTVLVNPVGEYSYLGAGIMKTQPEHCYDGSGNIYSNVKANNGPGAVNNCNFQKISFQTAGYNSSNLVTINFTVTGMTSFMFNVNQAIPSGCSVTWSYSINNGGAYTTFTPGVTVIQAGSTVKFKSVLTPTTTATPIIYSYSCQVFK